MTLPRHIMVNGLLGRRRWTVRGLSTDGLLVTASCGALGDCFSVRNGCSASGSTRTICNGSLKQLQKHPAVTKRVSVGGQWD